ncbi:trypsin-like peptidase domain-containing protein [Hydrogenophaga sp. 5NK40-0174]|uniref:trypsin-like serine peptidase n=1 Tax=Hydrogenophaga sp. 5NK40-0174 TaxID=3127649 RepID=UPI0031044605
MADVHDSCDDDGVARDTPLTHAQAKAAFCREAKGDIPKELQHMLLPELPECKLVGIQAEKAGAPEREPIRPMIPDWFAARAAPLRAKLPPPMRVMQRGKELDPLVVFAPEDRRIYNDTSYPWGTICRVVTAGGGGSGVIVGPRHVLTASHMMNWGGNLSGTVEVHRAGGFVRASTPYISIYHYNQLSAASISFSEVDEDYVVLVTADRIGDLFGWMGTRTYNSSWDGEPYWWNVGYPSAIGGGLRPTFQREKFLDEPWNDLGAARSMRTDADLTPGNSGGPVFGFWDEGPYVVSVASSQSVSANENWCSGGRYLTNLVHHAISQSP